MSCATCQHPEHVGRCAYWNTEDMFRDGWVFREVVGQCACGFVDSLIADFGIDLNSFEPYMQDDGI